MGAENTSRYHIDDRGFPKDIYVIIVPLNTKNIDLKHKSVFNCVPCHTGPINSIKITSFV